MPFTFWRSCGDESGIQIPAIGLNLYVRLPPTSNGGVLTVIETVNAPGFGPPRHRHKETEVFRVLEGKYLYEVDGKRFHAETGDVVSVPGGSEHAFLNIAEKPARQLIMILPGLDAAAFFDQLAALMKGGIPDQQALNAFGAKWGVDFVGPPLKTSDVVNS